MKDLIIPVKKDNVIDLCEINKDFKGIIICYYDSKPVGHIVENDYDWIYYDNISIDNDSPADENLLCLIEDLIDRDYITSCKVIEYDEID